MEALLYPHSIVKSIVKIIPIKRPPFVKRPLENIPKWLNVLIPNCSKRSLAIVDRFLSSPR